MSKIFVTGDTHMGTHISKLNSKNFPEQKSLTKNDYVIICGDFGLVWNNSKEEHFWRDWLEDKNFTTLFIDGNHENHKMLNNYPVEIWNGGKVSFINDSIIHLKRGQVFNINNNTFFTMGGATSIDKMYRTEGISWWKEELPSSEEIEEAIDNLTKVNWEIDYVLTHTTSRRLTHIMGYYEIDILNSFFDMLEKDLKYKKWFFGHFHRDKQFENHIAIFNDIKTI